MTGRVISCKRFAVHDGPGVRTTVFFKGCSLRCVWCHNPESMDSAPRLAFHPARCAGCGQCAEACPGKCHVMGAAHTVRFGDCLACGLCAQACPTGALELLGREVTAEALAAEALRDRAFFAASGGGVTFSGGECLLQAAFLREVMVLLKGEGIHLAVDTCGQAPWSAFQQVLPYTDLFLYDVKAADPAVHQACTGRGNDLILDNLRRLDETGKPIEVRIPCIPGRNTGELPAIGALLAPLRHITRVTLLPYNNCAGSKYTAIGLEDTMPKTEPPTPAELAAYRLSLTASR